jgi:hypothetical protein
MAARIASPMLPPPINAIFILITSYMIVILLFRYSQNEQKNSFSILPRSEKDLTLCLPLRPQRGRRLLRGAQPL